MSRRKQVALVSGLLLSLSMLARAEKPASGVAEAELLGPGGERLAMAKIVEGDGGVRVVLEALKLPPGAHGLHFHEAGKCEGPDFKSAGAHYNPAGKEHGRKNPKGHHAGDLPNLVVARNGTGKLEVSVPGLTLKQGGAGSLMKEGGTALVIHATEDDEKSNPSGNSGDRIACGVIRLKK